MDKKEAVDPHAMKAVVLKPPAQGEDVRGGIEASDTLRGSSRGSRSRINRGGSSSSSSNSSGGASSNSSNSSTSNSTSTVATTTIVLLT